MPRVLIVGAGPTGLMIANFLGQTGIDTLVLERNPATTDEPKAVSIDEESLRLLQAVGLYDQIREVLLPGTGTRYYGRGSAQLGAARGPQPPRYGHPIKSELNQPEFERALLNGAHRFACVGVRFNTEVIGLEQDDAGVLLHTTGEDQQPLRADYVIGADGGRSTMRKLLGIRMLGSSMEEPWIVLDTRNDPHTVRYAMHHGDPDRPHVIIPGRYGVCRYEFLLLPGESAEEMLRFDNIRRLVAPYREIKASDIVRSKVYTFHALVAARWQVHRVLIAGDAAHMMPPFAGQGLNSGLRDAHNLSWKLRMVVQGHAGPGLLNSYEQERRAHAEAMIQMSVRMGRMLMTRSHARALLRDVFFRSVGQLGPVKRYVTEMRYKPEPRYRDGLRIGRDGPNLGGSMLPQPTVLFMDGQTRLLDEALGCGFGLVGLATNRTEDPFLGLRHPVWEQLEMRRVVVYPEERWPARRLADICQIVDVEDRLVPEFWPSSATANRILLVRPDRYVAGAFTPDTEWTYGDDLVRQLDAPWLRKPQRKVRELTMPNIVKLGHTGVWVNDLDKMKDFYTRVLGLTVTDEDPSGGMVFLSSHPDEEHHEFVLARGRVGGPEVMVAHQFSWRVASLEDVLAFHARFKHEGIEVQQEVSHGNAIAIYFFDPEGNRNEVYWPTGRDVRQPFRKTLNLEQSADSVLAESDRLVSEGGPVYQPVTTRPRQAT
ncbi:MAG: bifunctional 3-(3-hydroxy-phenyl)propionate/3-hydroxycinnamic acid hydroxylase [Chloroflexota bacterium]|nr:bifunctional 3-(3-hydroxy-phenyl)propionate/3-hydroxycinnamic acid hydroxylase [Chloroflexota bacterium]